MNGTVKTCFPERAVRAVSVLCGLLAFLALIGVSPACTKSSPLVRTGPEPSDTGEQALTVLFCGDIMLDWGIKQAFLANGPEYLLKGIKKELDRYHVRVANLECPIADEGDPDPMKKYLFLGDPAHLPLLAYAGINAVFLANNHSTDYGDGALIDTIINLQLNGIEPTGAGEDIETARRPVVLKKNGITIALFSYTNIYAEYALATVNRPGVAPAHLLHIRNDIQRYRSRADFIVIGLHWGREYSDYPDRQQVALAHAIMDSGADVIIGHHSHIYQGIEIYDGRPIFYSLGNFIFGSINEDIRDNILAGLRFEKDGMRSLRVIPVTRNNATRNNFQYRMLDGSAAASLFKHLLDISQPLGDDFTESAFQEGSILHYSFDR